MSGGDYRARGHRGPAWRHVWSQASVPQARALGIWAGISAVALGIGPLAGGALVDLDWRLIFWINLPIAGLGIAIMALAAPESTDPDSGRRFDLPGLVTLGARSGGGRKPAGRAIAPPSAPPQIPPLGPVTAREGAKCELR